VRRMATLYLAIAALPGVVAVRHAGSQPRPDRPQNLLDCRNSDGDTARAVAVGPDGKIVLAGGHRDDFALVRYLPDGSLDGRFGDGGVVITDLGSDDHARAVALAPGGKIVVAGSTTGGFHAAVARYDADGRLDPTFGGDGTVVSPDGRFDSASAVAVQPDGRIIVSGTSEGDTVVTRYLPDGGLDPAFGEGGVARVAGGRSGLSVALAADGDILAISGLGGSGQADADFALVRLNGDGSLDRSFDGDGIALLDFGGKDEAFGVAAGPGDTVVAVGSTSTGASGDHHGFAVGRLRSDGSPDAAFGGDGRMVFSPSGKEQAYAVAVQPDGHVVVGGSVSGRTSDFGLVRLRPDGSLDDAFGRGGLTTTDFSGDEWASAVAVVTADGGLVAAGITFAGRHPSNIAVARYHPDGSPHEAFDSDGLVITDLSARDCP
jgi:uncharacterized delta-60 repeat protein